MDINKIEQLILFEKNQLISQWSFVHNQYDEIEYKKYYHRTELKHVDGIKEIKHELYEKIGVFPIYVFLTDYFHELEFPGAYFHIDKGLLIIYQLVSGLSINKMHKYINYSTFFKIYKRFYVYYKENLNKWINKMMVNDIFTNKILRLLYAKLNNPKKLKNITCYIDGYDSRISYQDIHFNKKRLHSYKFKKPGFRTQFLIDLNGFILAISPSLPCSDKTDGQMLETLHLEKHIMSTDCILLDGGYPQYLDNLFESLENKGYDINLEYFVFPYRKNKNEELTRKQLQFNNEIGSMRSSIESFFAKFTNMFLRFNKQNIVSVTENELYNTQIKLASILYNIKNAINTYDITFDNENYYALWLKDDFDFVRKDNKSVEFELEPKYQFSQEYINNKIRYQDEILANMMIQHFNINENNIVKDKNNMVIDEDDIFEVERIIGHKKYKGKYKYHIKWAGYEDTTWEHEDDILEKDCVDDYWNTFD